MNTTALPLAAGDAAGGYWTIQVTDGGPEFDNQRYVCRAQEPRHARALAWRLARAAHTAAWYDCLRIDDCLYQHVPTLRLRQSERIDSADVWNMLRGRGPSRPGRNPPIGSGVAR